MTPAEPEKKLRILHGPGGAAGQPSCIAKAQAELGVTAHSLCLGASKFQYHADFSLPVAGDRSYCQAFADYAPLYDVFHFYFRPFFYNSRHCGYPMGMDVLALRAAGKAVVLHFRGSEIRLHSKFREASPYHYVEENPHNLVSGFPEPAQQNYIDLMQAVCSEILVPDPELQSYCPDARIVPRALDLASWEYVGVNGGAHPPLIVHAPSRRTVKGTDMLMAALDRLRARGVAFRLQLVENMPHAEAREVYRQADIVVDQLRIGWYGVLSVEAMALGKPVLAYIREDLRHHLLPHPPLVMTSPETLERDLERLLTDPGRRKDLAVRARSYVEETHDSRKVAAELLAIYHNCLTSPRPLDFQRLSEFIAGRPFYRSKSKKVPGRRWLPGVPLSRTLNYYRRNGGKQTLLKISRKLVGRQ